MHHECCSPATHEADRNVTHAQSRDQELTASPFPWLHKNKPCRGAVVSLNAGGRDPTRIHPHSSCSCSLNGRRRGFPSKVDAFRGPPHSASRPRNKVIFVFVLRGRRRGRPPGRKPLLFSPAKKGEKEMSSISGLFSVRHTPPPTLPLHGGLFCACAENCIFCGREKVAGAYFTICYVP